jgi:lysophospholipase L1-like esterase
VIFTPSCRRLFFFARFASLRFVSPHRRQRNLVTTREANREHNTFSFPASEACVILKIRCYLAGALAFSLLLLIHNIAAAQSSSAPSAASPLPTLFIVGDSTANVTGDPADGAKQRVGWGAPFAAYFDPAKIRVVNAASAGRSSRTFMQEGKWIAVLDQLKPGDFVLIQFGHNDGGSPTDPPARGSLPGIGDDTQEVTHPDGTKETVHSFGWYTRKYIDDARAKGATPIVLSVTPRNIWTDGKVEPGLGQFREWAAQVATHERADYVDLTGIVVREYQKLGPDKVAAFFPLDHTHTDAAGAALNARSVVAGLKSLPDTPLTAFFSAAGAAVPSVDEALLALPANPKLHTFWIIGDSTVRNGQGDGSNGQWGWGDEIAPYFNAAKINVVNRALGGRSSRTFYNFLWPTVLGMIKPGDVVIMQFGHNDSSPLDDTARARGTLPGNGEETKEIYDPITRKQEVVHTFGWYERQIIEQARSKGATPIVASLIPRKTWTNRASPNAKIVRADYAAWAKQAAQQDHALFVDLNAIIADQYDKFGPDKVEGFFGDPNTHTNLAGAKMNAESVIEGLQGLPHDPLKKYLSPAGRAVRPWRENDVLRQGTASAVP